MEGHLESAVRGTPDCPFAYYHFSAKPVQFIYTHIHWHPEMEILFVQKGAIRVRINHTDHELSQGCIALVNPNQLHAVSSLNPDSEYYAFVFSLDLISCIHTHFFQTEFVGQIQAGKLLLPSVLTESDEMYNTVLPWIQKLCQCKKDQKKYKISVYTSLFNFFSALMNHPGIRIHHADSQNETVKKCLQFMKDHLSEQLTLSDIANQVHLHPNYLCALFKNYTNQTVFENLHRIRLDHAAYLLRNTDLSVSQTAMVCGFSNVCYFTQKFKSIFQITPKNYKKTFRSL
jgi:AraC-like DNA-binding protein